MKQPDLNAYTPIESLNALRRDIDAALRNHVQCQYGLCYKYKIYSEKTEANKYLIDYYTSLYRESVRNRGSINVAIPMIDTKTNEAVLSDVRYTIHVPYIQDPEQFDILLRFEITKFLEWNMEQSLKRKMDLQ